MFEVECMIGALFRWRDHSAATSC